MGNDSNTSLFMANDITWFIDLKFSRSWCWYFCAVCFILSWADNIFAIVRYLNFIYCLCVLQFVILFPFSSILSKAKHHVITTTCKDVLAILTNSYVCTKFFMPSKTPILIRLVSFDKLFLKLIKINFILFLCFMMRFFFLLLVSLWHLLLLFIFIFLILFNLFFFWVYFHGFDNVIINHPNIIFIFRCNWFSSVGPIWFIILFNRIFTLLFTFLLLFLLIAYILLSLFNLFTFNSITFDLNFNFSLLLDWDLLMFSPFLLLFDLTLMLFVFHYYQQL